MHEKPSKKVRFKFGKNWQAFLKVLNEERIQEAIKSIKTMLSIETLENKTFIDIGSGSGLFSLAAMKLGAKKVHSFDYDPQSVECTKELKRRYFLNNNNWTIEQGSALDKEYISKLGKFDIVYSWGVLHHTGDMWQALGNVIPLVKKSGVLYIAIYNDQGGASKRWKIIKRSYSKSGFLGRQFILFFMISYFEIRHFLARVVKLKNPFPFKEWKEYKKSRGMSRFHDYIDWIGGYPFEVAKSKEVIDFFSSKGFELIKLKDCFKGYGNNEFVFKKNK